MKVSVCINILNEEGSIESLLDSLLSQTKSADEIVIVDAESKDKTVDIVRRYQKKNRKLKLIIEPGSIAHGRNTAIENAKNEIIAMTDAGCIARADWLYKITTPFKDKNTGIVAGFYHMSSANSLQKAMNVFHGVTPKEFDKDKFIPSARSFAIRKLVWKKIGGFSEKLTKAGEDTLFFYKSSKMKIRIVRVKEAIVEWNEPETFTLIDSAKKFYSYALGDAQAGIWWHSEKQFASHNIRISMIFLRYLSGLFLIMLTFQHPRLWLLIAILFFLYIFWSFYKVYRLTDDIKTGAWGVPLQFIADVAVMKGFLDGLLTKY